MKDLYLISTNTLQYPAEKFKVLLDKGFILEEKINDSIDLFNINNEYLYS